MYGNRVLEGIFRPNREEQMPGENYIMSSLITYILDVKYN
jgi:hypothetical protein